MLHSVCYSIYAYSFPTATTVYVYIIMVAAVFEIHCLRFSSVTVFFPKINTFCKTIVAVVSLPSLHWVKNIPEWHSITLKSLHYSTSQYVFDLLYFHSLGICIRNVPNLLMYTGKY